MSSGSKNVVALLTPRVFPSQLQLWNDLKEKKHISWCNLLQNEGISYRTMPTCRNFSNEVQQDLVAILYKSVAYPVTTLSYCFKSVMMKKELQSVDWRDAKREESSFSHLKPQPATSPAFSSWLQQREPAALYSIKESRKRSVMPWPQKTDGRGGVRSRGFLHLKVD